MKKDVFGNSVVCGYQALHRWYTPLTDKLCTCEASWYIDWEDEGMRRLWTSLEGGVGLEIVLRRRDIHLRGRI